MNTITKHSSFTSFLDAVRAEHTLLAEVKFDMEDREGCPIEYHQQFSEWLADKEFTVQICFPDEMEEWNKFVAESLKEQADPLDFDNEVYYDDSYNPDTEDDYEGMQEIMELETKMFRVVDVA